MNNQMEHAFLVRTEYHRLLVRKNLYTMEGYQGLDGAILERVADQHDMSKYQEPERFAYIWITWRYQNSGKNYPSADIEDKVYHGWQHHIKHNLHHPEAHNDPNRMDLIDIVEMVCDWTAINQEQQLNQGSCKPWALSIIDEKWSFSSGTKKIIFSCIDELDKRNGLI